MIRKLRAIAFFSLFLFAVACAKEVLNVEAQPLYPIGPVTQKQVGDAIRRAGAGLGWIMRPVSPGKLEATLRLREHVAVVDIEYDTKTFSIRYKDSQNLNYDGRTIHRNYNSWIRNLERAINAQVTAI